MVRCPICHSQETSALCPVVLAGTEPVYELTGCAGCLSRFLDPLPTQKELNRFYAPAYYGSDWDRQEGKGRVFARAMLPRNSAGKFLDVGCSLGFFIEGIRRNSRWEVYGVEISADAVAFARNKLNLNVSCGDLPEAGYPDSFFDYIHICNVLEHVLDPLEYLKECRRILRPAGRLYLCVPNGPVDSAALVRYYKSEGGPARSKDGHLFFFSQDAMRRIFQEAGFQILSIRTYGIRRGLRALGFYPQKPGWKKDYRPKPDSACRPADSIELPNRRRRPPGYYAYRFRQARLKMLPGSWRIGLDFEIILT